ncbi:MAG: hypothetical protein ABDH20_13140 [Thermus sp.]
MGWQKILAALRERGAEGAEVAWELDFEVRVSAWDREGEPVPLPADLEEALEKESLLFLEGFLHENLGEDPKALEGKLSWELQLDLEEGSAFLRYGIWEEEREEEETALPLSEALAQAGWEGPKPPLLRALVPRGMPAIASPSTPLTRKVLAVLEAYLDEAFPDWTEYEVKGRRLIVREERVGETVLAEEGWAKLTLEDLLWEELTARLAGRQRSARE